MMNSYSRRMCYYRLLSLLLVCGLSSAATGQSPAIPNRLEVRGDVLKPLSLSLDDLRRMPRKSISVRNENKTREETYEGVPIAELMKEAGTPQGTQLRGRDLATYVLATGSDGYRALFSVAEVAPGFQDSEIIVADTLDGAPLSGKLGPLRLVVPHDQRLARWVRMLRSINVVRIPGPD